jgi:hypothetical protein
MGLDASVRCDCWEAGRTSEPPVPRDWLDIDEGDFLALDFESCSEEDHEAVEAWRESACAHPGMLHACERIGSYSWCRAFTDLLEEVGEGRFAALLAAVGSAAPTPAVDSAKALEALLSVKSMVTLTRKGALVDTASGEALYDPLLCYHHHYEPLVTESELIICDAATKAVLFRSKRFRQTRLGPGDAELLDLNTGRRFRSEVGVWVVDDDRQGNVSFPNEFHVEVRSFTPEDLGGIIAALEAVFRASAETGRPVRWH